MTGARRSSDIDEGETAPADELDETSTQPEVEAWGRESTRPAGFSHPSDSPGQEEPAPALEPEWDFWVEADSSPPEPEGLDPSGLEGDGPFPVDLGASSRMSGSPSRPRPSAFGPSPRITESTVASAAPRPVGPLGARSLETPFQTRRGLEEVQIARRRKGLGTSPSGRSTEGFRAGRGGESSPPEKHWAPPRRYPKMRALLSNPDLVPEGSAPLPEPKPPPVPGTFIPSPPPPSPSPEPGKLDGMLALMADGLFIGEGPEGATEVRVTLKDEFFEGTELRISIEEGRLSAVLVPPTRDVYWQLGGEASRLRERLERKGLRVSELRVEEPQH